MGCGIKFRANEDDRQHQDQAVQVFFTKNGQEVGIFLIFIIIL